jgi:hypothetical protein
MPTGMTPRPVRLVGEALTSLVDEGTEAWRALRANIARAAPARGGAAEIAGPDVEIDLRELERLREQATHAGAATLGHAGWLAAVLRGRLARAAARRTDWDAIYPGLPRMARAERRIAQGCIRAAVGAGVSSAAGHAGELATAMSEGLTAPVFLVGAVAAVALETVYTTMVQADLACDLASIYGVPFAVGDTGELATVFEVALGHAGDDGPQHASDARRLLAHIDRQLLARVGRTLAADALLGLVPLVGIPASVAKNYFDTRRVGASALRYVAGRRAVSDTLGETLPESELDKTLLLEGAWLVSTCDDYASHEELLVLSALAHAIPDHEHPPVERLAFVGEGVWVIRMTLLDDDERRAVFDALHVVAALRGDIGVAERAFFERVGAALELAVDYARMAAMRARVAG